MSRVLADILHLAGTARYNTVVRQKAASIAMTPENRKELPAHYLRVPQYFNHSSLGIVNANAVKLGNTIPFEDTRELPPDNGERFFSQYLEEQQQQNETVTPHINTDRCQCKKCGNNPAQLLHETISPTIFM
jgi:hypothetical protein